MPPGADMMVPLTNGGVKEKKFVYLHQVIYVNDGNFLYFYKMGFTFHFFFVFVNFFKI